MIRRGQLTRSIVTAAAILLSAFATHPTAADEDSPSPPKITINVTTAPIRFELPILIDAPDYAASVKLAFKTVAMERYAVREAKKQGGQYLVVVPCEHTHFIGELRSYVVAYDADGHEIARLGTRETPIVIKLVEKMPSKMPAPTLPGGVEPGRCDENGCPVRSGCPDFFFLHSNSPCALDEECSFGHRCVVDDDGRRRCMKPRAPRVYIGLHGQLDTLFLGRTSEACRDNAWACTKDDRDIGRGSASTDGGLALGTVRALASVDYFLTHHVSLGLRLGYAFRGNAANFLPYHAELRVQLFPLSIDADGPGVRGFLSLSSGIGEVNAARRDVTVFDALAPSDTCDGKPCVKGVSAYRRAGMGFLAVGGGAWILLGPRMALAGSVQLAFFAPTTALGMSGDLGVLTRF